MASGIGDRPLPNLSDERTLLNLGQLKCMSQWITGDGWSRVITFSNTLVQSGLLFLWGAAGTGVDKEGIYYFAKSTSSNFHMRTIRAPSQSGLSVTANSNGTITVVNGIYGLGLGIVVIHGDLPTIAVP